MSEIWSLVDSEGREVGVNWLRSERESMPEGLCHPCVEVWVMIGDKLLLTKRHPNKSNGLKFDCPGGAVVKDESMIDGAIRELFEEVGISASADDLRLLGGLAIKKVYANSYLLRLESLPELKLQPSEVVGYELMTESQVELRQDELTPGTRSRFMLYRKAIFNG